MENRPYRILLVEDDEDDYFVIRDLVREVKEPSIELEWAPTFTTGKEKVLGGKYDVCLVDYRLGERTGVDLLEEAIRANILVPIILLTGYGDQDVEREAMRIGAADYLVKGEITAQLLARAIRYAIYRGQTQSQILRQDRLASVGLLASSLAHEIGTPLGVVRGRAEYALMNVEDKTSVEKNLTIILSEIDRISKLIQSLLNLARGSRTKTITSVPLSAVLDDVLSLMAHEFRKNGITVENAIDASAGIAVRAESEPLHQVVLNLLVNAVHAIQASIQSGKTESHRIRISASVGDTQCVLSIQDTGCGISPNNMKELFKPFFTTKDIGVGTGLGLATSYNILQSWGGDISVESREGVGTEFQLRLPLA